MKKTITRRHRGCLWWLSRLFVRIFILILALVTVGFTYETITSRNDLDQYPPPGKLVDVGGYKMHLYCTGEANEEQPTVVLVVGDVSSQGRGEGLAEQNEPVLAAFALIDPYFAVLQVHVGDFDFTEFGDL